MTTTRFALGVALAVSISSAGACGGRGVELTRCTPGTTAPCDCSGRTGTSTCASDGLFDACACPDAGMPDSALRDAFVPPIEHRCYSVSDSSCNCFIGSSSFSPPTCDVGSVEGSDRGLCCASLDWPRSGECSCHRIICGFNNFRTDNFCECGPSVSSYVSGGWSEISSCSAPSGGSCCLGQDGECYCSASGCEAGDTRLSRSYCAQSDAVCAEPYFGEPRDDVSVCEP